MYLLDSSAWLAHLLGEPGMEQVNLLFDDSQAEINISALSIPEIYARLRAMDQQERWQEVWESYSALFTRVLVADEAVAFQAIALRSATTVRLPTIDGLIAATAAGSSRSPFSCNSCTPATAESFARQNLSETFYLSRLPAFSNSIISSIRLARVSGRLALSTHRI